MKIKMGEKVLDVKNLRQRASNTSDSGLTVTFEIEDVDKFEEVSSFLEDYLKSGQVIIESVPDGEEEPIELIDVEVAGNYYVTKLFKDEESFGDVILSVTVE